MGRQSFSTDELIHFGIAPGEGTDSNRTPGGRSEPPPLTRPFSASQGPRASPYDDQGRTLIVIIVRIRPLPLLKKSRMSDYDPDQKMAERLAYYPPSADSAIQFEVRVVAKRKAYGRTDFYIVPRRGQGGKWVSEKSLQWI